MTNKSTMTKAWLLAGAAFAIATSAPAFAQSQTSATAEEDNSGDIVVTGTLFKNAKSSVPVTTVTAADLDARGISTVQDAIQQLSSNNGPALTNSFTANGAFAAGASAVSLRGLSTNSTLVLFDGLRAAYYPLADDGSRNFVDLNTIPDDIIDRVEVLRDGASALYGADAIAGVVNIITKKQFKGVAARAEAGIAEGGYGAQYRLSATLGFGDLEEKGFNAYISGFYYKSDQVKNSSLPFPYNTDDLRNLCLGNSGNPALDCGANGVVNGQGTNLPSTAGSFLVRPYTQTGTTIYGSPIIGTPVAGSTYQLLNPTCQGGTPYTLSAAERAANPISPATVCSADYTNLYGVVQPNINRFGVSGRVTAKLGDTTEAYVEVNFLQSRVNYTGFPATVYGTANTGIFFPQFSTAGTPAPNRAPGTFLLALPVYVCPERINCATSANRTLNPNNPFAAQGLVARVIGRDLTTPTYNETRNRAYRIAFGVDGNITDNITYNVGGTAMHTDLRRLQRGYVYIQHLLDVINDGTYNWINPGATPQNVLNYLKPDNITNASSDQYQIQASLNGSFFDLPGGKLQVAVGGSVRYEAVDAPSANSDINGPTQRYFTLNAFGTKGSREIYSAFGEIKAPILDILEVNAAGRYDNYSSGQSAFSPKVGLLFTPVRQLTIRGSWSRGFRIPAFGEANALPTTGFVSNNASIFNNTYLAQYGCTTATFSTACPVYIRSGSYGQTTLASPNLQPEKSRSFTVGADFTPRSNIKLSVDYYNIRKTNVIVQPSNAPALAAYYSGQPIPAGYTVIADAPDPNFPNATPRVAFVQSQLINATSYQTSGLDFDVNTQWNIGNVKWRSNLNASLILSLTQTFPDGSVERYDGTLGNFNLTAGSGTPKWRGYWQNQFDFGRVVLTGTANYTSGYDQSAQDQGTGYKDCGFEPYPGYCRVASYITFDLNTQFKVNDKFTFYITALNLFDNLPPIDPTTYGAHLYNPVQGGNGILGRYWKAGITAKF